MTNLDSVLKSRVHIVHTVHCTNKVHIAKATAFPVVMYGCELDHKEGWQPKNWCLQIVVLKKTPENPLDSKEINPVNPKENQPWIFMGRTDAEVEDTILWPLDMKRWLTGKDPDAGKYCRQKETGWQRMKWFDGITNSVDMKLSKLWEWRTEEPGVLQSMGSQRVGHDLATEQEIHSHFQTYFKSLSEALTFFHLLNCAAFALKTWKTTCQLVWLLTQ